MTVASLLAAALAAGALPASAEPIGPSAPRNLAASPGPGAGEATLAWEPASGLLGVASYRVYRADDAGVFLLVAEVGSDQLSYVDAGLANGATYLYAVRATDAVGEGPWSDRASVTTFTVPDAPESVSVAAGPGPLGEATVAWSPPARDGGLPVTAYAVYRDDALVATVDGAARSWTDAGLSPLHAYSYRVAAVNAAGEGAPSEAACGMASPWTALSGLPACMSVL